MNIVGIVSFFAKLHFSSERCKKFKGKCLRVRKITRKSEENRLFVFTIKIIMYFCKNKKNGVITSIE